MGFAQTVNAKGEPEHRQGKGSYHQIGLVRGQFGFGLLGTDLDAGLPVWWVIGEGPGLVAFGVVKLFLYRRASRSVPSVT